jgi:hypothetical protein
MVHTQTEARQFFVDKVIQKADAEGIALSEGDHYILVMIEGAVGRQRKPW